MANPVLQLAQSYGVVPSYTDATGKRHDLSEETAHALLAAMGSAGTDDTKTVLPRDVICVAGSAPDWTPGGQWTLTFEDGAQTSGTGALPKLPLGIHRLVHSDGARATLLAAPKRLPLPARDWGVIAPLYALSDRGIGSYDDLTMLARDLGAQGAGFLGLNPVHAGFPAEPGLFSPYTPSHRRRLNAMHLPGGTGSMDPLVDYVSDIPQRMTALRAEFESFAGDPAFDDWVRSEGYSLQRFALHQALSFEHGAFWNSWPTDLQNPDSPACAQAARRLTPEMRFHTWLQWRAETALHRAQAAAKDAGMSHGLYLDLAVGTHPYGAETWEDRGSFAFGAALGSPPDAFSAEGQNWGLAPLNPRALRDRAYAPLAETLRRQLQLSGLLRIDHILGFERAFWVPDGAPGAYVQMPRDAMLAVARIEATRAQAAIIGEDLGNIPDGLRGALKDSGILGCRLAMFERTGPKRKRFRRPGSYDAAAIASFSTHDLPTWDGWQSSADIAAHARLGHLDAAAAKHETANRKAETQALAQVLDSDDLDGMHKFLGQCRARLVALQIENLLRLPDQPNLPGTVDEYPNWRQRLPVSAKSLGRHHSVTRAAQIMRDAKR